MKLTFALRPYLEEFLAQPDFLGMVVYLELGEEKLTLDEIQQEPTQRQQKLKLRAESGSLKANSVGNGAVAYAAKHRGYSSSEYGRGSSNELGRNSKVRGGSSNPQRSILVAKWATCRQGAGCAMRRVASAARGATQRPCVGKRARNGPRRG